MGSWSKLPVDLLNAIEGYVMLYVDKVRIRVVCGAWKSYLPKLPNHQVKQLPWLLHPLGSNSEASHGLFNPIDKKVYEIYLPEARRKLFKGSSYGWVVTVEDRDSSSPTDMYLINPLTMARITLPPRTEFADVVQYHPNEVDEEFIVRSSYDVPIVVNESNPEAEEFIDETTVSSYNVSLALTMKIVLSSAPCDECVVVAIYGQYDQLAWCRCNDEKWTHIYAGLLDFMDIIFHCGKLHAITRYGELYVFENIGTDLEPKVTKIATSVPIRRRWLPYLVECSDGSLVVVGRHLEFCRDIPCKRYSVRTIGFRVYKLDSLNSTWVEVKNIGDDVLFLGFNSSRSISSHDLLGFKGNHIYFSDTNCTSCIVEENENWDSDIGVFNLEDETLESLPSLCQPIWPRPIWINVG